MLGGQRFDSLHLRLQVVGDLCRRLPCRVGRIFPPPFSRIPLKIKELVYFLRYNVVM